MDRPEVQVGAPGLPNEQFEAGDQFGIDPFHTPEPFAHALEREGFRVVRDAPLAGLLVPLRFYGKDPRVTSAMIEVRRGLYCDEATGERADQYDAVRGALWRGVTGAFQGQG